MSFKRSQAKAATIMIFGLAALFTAKAVSAGLDLSPQTQSYTLDGMTLSQLVFNSDQEAKPTYQPPRDWKFSGQKDQLTLQPQGVTQAQASVSKWSSPVAFDADGLQSLKERIVSSLPKGSEKVEVVSEEQNPLKIDGKQTYLLELNYVFYGERFAAYTLVLDRKPNPLLFRLNCRESDYKNLREAFHRSLFSWQNL